MPQYTQDDRILKLTTPLGDNALVLTSIAGREAVSELFHFTLEAIWQDSKPLDFKNILGQTITIELVPDESFGAPRYINGMVCSIAQGAWDREKDITFYTLQVVPQHWLLTRNTQIRIFQQMSTTDIIQKVIADLGLPSPTLKTQGSYPPREYCVQYRETDFAFISRLMEQDGIFYFFQHSQSSHTLVLADQKSSFEDLPGGADVEFEEVMSGPREDLRIFEWTKAQTIRSGNFTLRDWNFLKPTLGLESTTKSVVLPVVKPKLEVYEYEGKYQEPDEGDGVVKVRMQEEDTPGLVVHGKSWHWGFLPAYKFNLKLHFADKGKFVLTSVQTSCQQPLGTESDDAEYQNAFTAIPEDVVYRPARATPVPKVKGVQTAIVVGPSGEEIYTDKYGRIKVQFHWDREGQYNENSSCWVRVATSWAGKQWGAIYTPRIGQEVLVEFVDGNVDRPLVTGSVYNAEQMPPWTLPDNKNYSGIRSRSTKQADNDSLNEIRLDDTKGSEMFFLQAQKDMNLLVKNDRVEQIKNDSHLTVAQNDYTNINADQHITVKGTRSTEIKTDDNLTVDGKAATHITGSYSLKVDSNVAEKFAMNHAEETGQALYLKAGMNVVIEAGVELTLKAGSNFIDIGPAGIAITGSPLVLINSGGASGAGVAGNLVSALAPKAAQLPITTNPTAVAALLSQSPPAGGGGSGGGSGAGGASGNGSSSSISSSSSPPGPRHDPDSDDNKDKTHWVEIVLVDDAGQPVAGEVYEITLPDGSVASGTTNEKGMARVENVDAGSVDISFPELDKDAWEPA
jgi:type VI secretion system secreted protein VgrG